MDIEKTLFIATTRDRVWELILDPTVMGGAVPGIKSIEVVSPTEYVAVMHQKVSFISAKFKLRTTIVEQRAPEYLCAEGSGEDAAVASSLKQRTEVFLSPTSDGGTELRIKVHVDLLGRLGSFGLTVLKTKADRMWDEFGKNLTASIEGTTNNATVKSGDSILNSDSVQPVSALSPQDKSQNALASDPRLFDVTSGQIPDENFARIQRSEDARVSWWSHALGLLGIKATHTQSIYVEIIQQDRKIKMEWPVERADALLRWLNEYKSSGGPEKFSSVPSSK